MIDLKLVLVFDLDGWVTTLTYRDQVVGTYTRNSMMDLALEKTTPDYMEHTMQSVLRSLRNIGVEANPAEVAVPVTLIAALGWGGGHG